MQFLKVLVVEDFDRFRQFVTLTLRQRSEFLAVYEASDGLEAVYRAEQLRPDLILLDIGLPKLSGIEACRRIRHVSPDSKILFVSQESSSDVIEEVIRLGAWGFVLKLDAIELLAAVNAVLQDKQYFSRRVKHFVVSPTQNKSSAHSQHIEEPAPLKLQGRSTERVGGRAHKVVFYRDDASLVDDFTCLIETALRGQNPIITIATESHRTSVKRRLESLGWDVAAAMQQGSYMALDVDDLLSRIMVKNRLDSSRFFRIASDLFIESAKTARAESFRVTVCGECAPRLIAQHNPEEAVKLEHLWDKIARSHYIDIFCGYFLGDFQLKESSVIFERICREHSVADTL